MIKVRNILALALFFGTACSTGSCKPRVESDAKKPKVQEQDAKKPANPEQLSVDSDQLKSSFVTTPDGLKIHYQTIGSGTPVVLLHGYYATGKDNWYDNGIVPALIKTNMVILIDHRGHGKSDKPHEASAYGEHMWQDALLVMDELKIKKAHIHGYSMGGSITTQLLFHHPDRFLTAIYGGSGIGVYSESEKSTVPKDAEGPDPQEVDAKKVLLTALKHDMEAMKACGANAPWDGPEHEKIDLTKVNIPVLALNGEFDHPNAKTYRMKKELKNFKSVVFKGKSHLTTITPGFIPDNYITELVAFITANNP